MKVQSNGQAEILSPEQMNQLFAVGLTNDRDRALFGIQRYCGCRISEALSLDCGDVQPEVIVFRKRNTKGEGATREIPIHPELQLLLDQYDAPEQGYLFPGRFQGHLHRGQADRILRTALKRVGIEGASTHSFRRTALTRMSNAGQPLRVIQAVSGHKNLATLQRYLEVSDEQVKGAIAAL